MKVLFLDIDGVLNNLKILTEAGCSGIDPQCVRELNRIVAVTGCRIVISSSWRYLIHCGAMTLTGFWQMLRTHGMSNGGRGNPFIGLTRKDEDEIDPANPNYGERAQQCYEWLRGISGEHNDEAERVPVISAFAALDDEDHEFAAHGIPAVITDGRKGLTAEDADRLIALLAAGG